MIVFSQTLAQGTPASVGVISLSQAHINRSWEPPSGFQPTAKTFITCWMLY